ncbi:MAG TPA: phosphate ABC transporter ATP-binding protein [Acidimicrobiales bacterium]|jgi:phosphate transport system ATP-binding protein
MHAEAMENAVTLENVAVSYGRVENAKQVAVKDVYLELPTNTVTALLGPSGCGKTTILRAINRLHDDTTGRVSGTIRVGDLDVYHPDTQPEIVRARVGMVFQRPNPFPTMNIWDNAVAGLRMNGVKKKSLLNEAAEAALRQAALWDEVKDRLRAAAISLSGGQQQRLCIARALAVEPEVLLLDEPTSALDPQSSMQIEQLITQLSAHITIALVTHNLFQARRVSDRTAVFLLAQDGSGRLVESGPTEQVFLSPQDERTKEYVTGHIG